MCQNNIIQTRRVVKVIYINNRQRLRFSLLTPEIIMQRLLYHIKKFLTFIYALFFTRDDDLDILQLLFAAIVVVTLFVTWNVSMMTDEDPLVKIEALITLRWLAGLLVITAVPKWMIPFMSDHSKTITRALRRPNHAHSEHSEHEESN